MFHGSDAGLVRERALKLISRRIEDRRDPFQFIEMSGDAVAAEPLDLLDEAHTAPLLGGRRAILVESGAKSILPALEKLIAAPPTDCSIVVIAGALRKDAPLRKLVEDAKLAAAVECSPDAEADLDALIDGAFKEAELSADPAARALLRAALGEDRMMSRSELQKLVLYMRDRKQVQAEDVAAIVANAALPPGDELTLAAFAGDASAAGADFDEAAARGSDATQLIVGALRYALALHRGRSGGGVMAVKRAGFFNLQDAAIETHLKLWPAARLTGLVETLRAAQTRARADGSTARLEAARVFMHIARNAKRG